MTTLEKIPGTKTQSSLPWVLTGGVVAPIAVILFSIMYADPTMRALQILIIVTLMGALAGRLVYAINKRSKEAKWWRSTAVAVGFILYILLVFLGFVVGRMGPF